MAHSGSLSGELLRRNCQLSAGRNAGCRMSSGQTTGSGGRTHQLLLRPTSHTADFVHRIDRKPVNGRAEPVEFRRDGTPHRREDSCLWRPVSQHDPHVKSPGLRAQLVLSYLG